jgi:ribulose-5-phosphate 4-epimerase/fuculose-1-phosphate aldolase
MDHPDPAELRAGRQQLVLHGIRLLDDGLAIGTAGNLSLRLGDTVLITPSGIAYRDLTPTDICTVTLTNSNPATTSPTAATATSPTAVTTSPAAVTTSPTAVTTSPTAVTSPTATGDPTATADPTTTASPAVTASPTATGGNLDADTRSNASSELPLHLAVYRATDAAAIVHTHSPEVVALSAVRDDLPAIHYAISGLGGPVRVAGYERFGSDNLAAAAVAALAGRQAVILRNHGAVTYGTSLAQAYDRALTLEWLARVYRMACSLGEPSILSAAELEEVATEMRRRRYGEPR